MTTGKLIALCSPAMQSGKTEVARYLNTNHSFAIVSFATPLKHMTLAFLRELGVHPHEARQRVYGDRKEAPLPIVGVTTRQVMQSLGTEWGRQQIKESVWVDLGIAQAKRYMSNGLNVIIDDMRYPNEYAAVTMAFGDCYRIVRPNTNVTNRHASEGQLDGVEMPVIRNDGNLAALYAKIDALVESL